MLSGDELDIFGRVSNERKSSGNRGVRGVAMPEARKAKRPRTPLFPGLLPLE